MRQPYAFGCVTAFVLQQRHGHPVRHGIKHRDRDYRALAGAAARQQRFQDRLVGIHAGSNVDDRDADARRRFRAAGDRGEPRLGLDQQVVSLALRIRAALAIA